MYQQLWGYKVEEKLYLDLREQKRLNTTALDHAAIGNGHYISQYIIKSIFALILAFHIYSVGYEVYHHSRFLLTGLHSTGSKCKNVKDVSVFKR
jgi:hypothetical protein